MISVKYLGKYFMVWKLIIMQFIDLFILLVT